MRAPLIIEAKNNVGDVVPYALVRVQNRAKGGDTDVFKDEYGPEEYSNPAVTGSNGRLIAWVERGPYNVIISGPGITTYTVAMDAVPGGDGTVDINWLSAGIRTYGLARDTSQNITDSVNYVHAPTPDIISGVVIPSNGLCKVGFYISAFTGIANSQGRIKLYLGEQPIAIATTTAGRTDNQAVAGGSSNATSEVNTTTTVTGSTTATLGTTNQGIATTGQTMLTPGGQAGQGFSHFFVEVGGTFDFSVRYKAPSGDTLTLTHRRIWLGVYAL